MNGHDHPPSTTSSPRVARRALVISAVALAAVIIPVGTVAAMADGTDSQEPSSTSSSIIDQVNDIRAQNAASAQLANIVALTKAVPTTAAPTTTTAPPPPPTTAAPAPAPVVQPVSSGGGYNDPNNPAAWDRLAQCESGGNWATNTGNGYYGGIQFSLGSWQSVGGTGRPDQASRETQIAMGQRLYHSGGGWVHWPGCSRALGYR